MRKGKIGTHTPRQQTASRVSADIAQRAGHTRSALKQNDRWPHQNKPTAWRGQGKHGARKPHVLVAVLGQQRHPPTGGWLADGRRPFLLHRWWIVRISGRSVGRCPGRLVFAPIRGLAPRCGCCVVVLSLRSCATAATCSLPSIPAEWSPVDIGVCSTAPCLGGFQGPSALLALCPIERTFYNEFGLVRRAKSGNALGARCGGLVWVWGW